MTTIATNLMEQAEGYWFAPQEAHVSYPALGHQQCLAVEDSSFWFGHRAECVVTAVQGCPPEDLFFDIGGGNGHVAGALADAGVACAVVEPGKNGADAAYERGIRPVVRATTRSAGFQHGTLPAVGLFDVLEHIEDDKAFLDEIWHLMEPGGRMYVTVPAYKWLWSVDDERAGHHRRYTARGLRSVVSDAGFRVEYVTYLFRFLPLPVLLARSLPSKLGRRTVDTDAGGDHKELKGAGGLLLASMLARERRNVERRRTMHFGGSVLMIARRPR